MANPSSQPAQRTFLGHPLGLYVLFFTEMWERFSYYGMRALLMLYMVNYLRWTQKDASTVYKVYTSFVYITPILGGFLADRFLGNRAAVIIGAVLMAIGHFLMAFEEQPIFLAALVFLIFGNGFFKPNMSTQVGRLYPANDSRRDGAYTIFYMGINLGAFLSPIACGWLAENTVGEYHSGFTLAGIGMVLGLMIYLFGQPWIQEIPYESPTHSDATAAEAASITTTTPQGQPVVRMSLDQESPHVESNPTAGPLTEAQAARQPSVLGSFSGVVPSLLILFSIGFFVAGGIQYVRSQINFFDLVIFSIAGLSMALMAYVCQQVQGGVRDRVLAILALGIFVVFFWAAFEQAGNVLNVWADQSTNRYLTRAPDKIDPTPPEVDQGPAKADGAEQPRATASILQRLVLIFQNMVTLKPQRGEAQTESWGLWLTSSFNPIPTAWFQAINALAIFMIAPIFAWFWVWLDRRGMQPSIPLKMALGLIFMSASMAIMLGAAADENRAMTSIGWNKALPAGIVASEDGTLAHKAGAGTEPFHAGRIRLDKTQNKILMAGVLPDNERDHLVEKTAPSAFGAKVEELRKASKKENAFEGKNTISVDLDEIPPGFDFKYAGIKPSIVRLDPANKKLTATQPLADKEVKGLLVAAGDPDFRRAIYELYAESTTFRVSLWWLFWSYILATLGELCLSPVGLSMVSKLAPAKFATMLMGVWLLTSAFGHFVAGGMGEIWGIVPPIEFFLLATGVVGGAALILLVLVKGVVAIMHGVK